LAQNLPTLAESTQRLGATLKASEPLIPWRYIAAFRHVFAHGYLGLDTEIVWSLAEQDLPDLRTAFACICSRIAPDPSKPA
jgi:uncharacterized protein with HEPN domain